MIRLFAALSALAAMSFVSAGMYGQPVINLDSKSFKEALSVEHAGMVAFVAPWCGHCKNLGPEFTAAAQSLSPLIPFYAIDCDEASNKPLCAQYEVKGFPTIKAFPKGLKGAVKDYQGERKRGALVEYAKSLVPDRVKKLRVEDGTVVEGVLQKFLDDKPDLPHALLVHPSAPSIPFLWKVLGHRFSSKLHLGFLRDTPSHGVLASLGIYDPHDTSRETTRVVAWRAGAERPEIIEHQGAMKFNALLEFLQAHLDGVPPPAQEPSEPQKEKAPPMSNEGRRQRAREKLEEAERRDQARREKVAAEAAAAAAKAAASDAMGAGQEAAQEEVEERGTSVEAEKPSPEENVEEETPRTDDGSAPDPVPEAGMSEEAQEGVQAEETDGARIHEEL